MNEVDSQVVKNEVARIFSKKSMQVIFKKIYKVGSSLKITIASLLALFILTFAGTYYQADFGLYAAQQKFFYSWIVMLLGIVPFPGGKLVMGVLSLNLFFAAFRYPYRLDKAGIITIHYGIIFLMVASIVTHYYAKESVVVLEEEQSTNVSIDYFDSEIAIWEQDGVKKNITAMDTADISPNTPIKFEKYGVTLSPVYFYEHAVPANFKEPGAVSSSGISSLLYLEPPKNREGISPGGLFDLNVKGAGSSSTSQRILLWESDPTSFPIIISDGREVYLRIQRKRYNIPFTMKLNKFIREQYFGTSIPKRYESVVDIIKEGASQPARIFMNSPLRTDGYVFFQASFSIDQVGNRQSVLATVENIGYWIPYAASLIIGIGLMFHFVVMFFKRIKRINLAQ